MSDKIYYQRYQSMWAPVTIRFTPTVSPHALVPLVINLVRRCLRTSARWKVVSFIRATVVMLLTATGLRLTVKCHASRASREMIHSVKRHVLPLIIYVLSTPHPSGSHHPLRSMPPLSISGLGGNLRSSRQQRVPVIVRVSILHSAKAKII